ncbi:GATA zinc finger domain-containing protein 1 [Diprion similis]|uniref:GATA zinc finger domain-containing protein 1 n=1 Tax=Diprion similis TaxID=362088 RepID=UPI001EF934E8|nr:GATA zinc finger domain-containing protein 1 [Diprion similis]
MPLGMKPKCTKCESTDSILWHSTDTGNICNNCSESDRCGNAIDDDDKVSNNSSNNANATVKNESNDAKLQPRKSTRVTRYLKNKPVTQLKVLPKGKGRRHIFKKTPIKAPAAVATPVTSDYVFYKGSYIQVGDIVSMQDIDGGIYYAQIRGLLTDQYCEKSAAVTWLIPTTASPPPQHGFYPETYLIGPEEDLPRKLECMEFVMHAPSDYYKLKNTPYPPPLTETGAGFVWTSLKHEISIRRKTRNLV